MEFPPLAPEPFAFFPLAARPSQTSIVQSVFPLVQGTASTPAQIAQALIVAGSGLARIDVFLTAAQVATISSLPIIVIPGVAAAVLVPVVWSMSKNTDVIGSINTVLSLQYASAAFNGFTSMTTINADTNNARAQVNVGMPSGGLNINIPTRDPRGLGLQVVGSADPGNFPASNTTIRLSIVFYLFIP